MFVGFLGYLFFIATIALLFFSIFAGPQTIEGAPNSPFISMITPDYRMEIWRASFYILATSIASIIVSGLCTSVVSCEYKYLVILSYNKALVL